MKKSTLLIVLSILVPCLCFAGRMIMIQGEIVPTPAAGGGACATPQGGDELTEGFIGAGYENVWQEGGGAPDEDFALTGAPVSDNSCSEGLNTISNEADSLVAHDLGGTLDSSETDIDMRFELYVDSATIDTYSTKVVASITAGNSAPNDADLFLFALRNQSPDLKFGVYANTNSGYIDIVVDTWYQVNIHCDTVSTASKMEVDTVPGTSVYQVWFQHEENDPQYVWLGTNSIGAGEVVDIEFGYVHVNTP